MPFVPIPNTVQVETVFTWDGQYCENVYHCQRDLGYDVSDMNNLLDVFRTWWDTHLKPIVPAVVSLSNLIATDQASQTGPRTEDQTGLPIAGTNNAAALPNNVTVAVRWTTEQRGRSYRGRTYHIGLTENHVTANALISTVQTSLITAYNQLIVDVTTAGWVLVVASRFSNNAPRVTGLATPITAATLDPTVDSQRRRLPGRGR